MSIRRAPARLGTLDQQVCTALMLAAAAADGSQYALAIMSRPSLRSGRRDDQVQALRAGAGVGDDKTDALIGVVREAATRVVLNDYYVEVPAGPASVAFSRRRFAEYREDQAVRPCDRTEIILDVQAVGADTEYPRIAALDVDWVMPPATQPRETAR